MTERFSADLLPLVRPIDFVIEDPDNAKLHPDESVDGIAASLKEFGQYKPVVFWYPSGCGAPVVKAGNGTLRAAKKLGWKRLAMTEFKGTEREAKTIAILDNKLPELAPWNMDVLAAQVAELGMADVPSWSAPEIKWDAPAAVTPADTGTGPVIDVVGVPVGPPAPPPKTPSTRVSPGDIWILTGPNGEESRLMCGDPKNPRVIRELCGMARPPLRRMVVAPDDRVGWWVIPENSKRFVDLGLWWPGWSPFSNALLGEVARAGWARIDLMRITHDADMSWLYEGALVSEKSYTLLASAGVEKSVFQHPYSALVAVHARMRTQEKADAEYIQRIVIGLLEPGEIFLDLDGGSGSFLGCMKCGRICFGMLASPEECDSVLETAEQVAGRKADKI
jgi:hypothetical protein